MSRSNGLAWRCILLFAALMFLSIKSNAETTGASDGIIKSRKEVAADSNSKNKKGSEGLELARTHLQELVPILEQLKLKSSGQYEKAVRELDRASKQLDSIKRRDHKLYEISLREWKTRCQIDLLKAKLHVQKSAPDQDRVLQRLKTLREIELERVTRELALLESRAQMHSERIAQSRQMLDKVESRRQQLLKEKQKLIEKSVDLSTIDSKSSESSPKKSVRDNLPADTSSKEDKK